MMTCPLIECGWWLSIGLCTALVVSLCAFCSVCIHWLTPEHAEKCVEDPVAIEECAATVGFRAAAACTAKGPPRLLRVNSPKHHADCAGEYELVVGEKPNGQPLWAKKGGDRWLYCGSDGRWYIGGLQSKAVQFCSASGFICHRTLHGNTLPHLMQGPWEWGGGGNWHEDSAISIAAVPTSATDAALASTNGIRLSSAAKNFAGLPLGPKMDAKGYAGGVLLSANDGLSDGTLLRGAGVAHCIVGKGFADGIAKPPSTMCLPPQGKAVTSGTTGKSGWHWQGANRTMQQGPARQPEPVAAIPNSSRGCAPGQSMTSRAAADGGGGKRASRGAPKLLYLLSPNGQQRCVGAYVLVTREWPNGQPVWRQQDGPHWLYSCPKGRWCVGGSDVKEDNFRRSSGWISQAAPHLGLMPDRSYAAWQRWTGDRFEVDKQIAIISQPYLGASSEGMLSRESTSELQSSVAGSCGSSKQAEHGDL
mmetsp:Transcript_104698/g.337562  ORF Transcript_104698/g.337562 Transcript_104698/m.337562 type:complete len:476 (-) Transcript_104698:57-1484(-)